MALLCISHRALAYAKVNLFLDIESKRSDGFHNILSVFREINQADELIIRKNRLSGLKLISDKVIENNILEKTYIRFKERYGVEPALAVQLKKTIPMGGGLGGGSSDAAAFLKYLYRKYQPAASLQERIAFAEMIGSDVPFFLTGGCMVAKGKGESLYPLKATPDLHVVLVSPGFSISTGESYKQMRPEQFGYGKEKFEAMTEAIRRKDIIRVAENMYNVFEENAFSRYPVLGKIKEELRSTGALNALMSGSGSTMFGVYSDGKKARAGFDILSRGYPKTFLAKTL